MSENSAIERVERPSDFDPAKWMAAAMEVAGTMRFKKITQPGRDGKPSYTYFRPYVQLQCETSKKVRYIQKLFNEATGNITKVGSKSTEKTKQFILTGDTAVAFAKLIKPYAISRKEIISYFEWWGEAESSLEHTRLIQKYNEQSHEQDLSASQYIDLVKDPSFLAGIIDLNGSIYSRYPNTSELTVSCKNISLLEALHKIYLGAKPKRRTDGSNSYQWVAANVDWGQISNFVKPYLQFK